MSALTLAQATRVAVIVNEELGAEIDPAAIEAASHTGAPLPFVATALFYSDEAGEATASFKLITSFSGLDQPCITGAKSAYATFKAVLRCRRANQRLEELGLELACSQAINPGRRARLSPLAA